MTAAQDNETETIENLRLLLMGDYKNIYYDNQIQNSETFDA